MRGHALIGKTAQTGSVQNEVKKKNKENTFIPVPVSTEAEFITQATVLIYINMM